MIKFKKPEIHKVDEKKDFGRFVIEPLERGYGTTMGNSMRRVLLSSLPGSAIKSVKIDGVLHEFSTIDGVVEDVSQIVLNLKKVVLRIDSEDEKELEINVSGPKTVTAGDLVGDGDVEIIDKDLPICTVAKGGTFHAIFTAEKGRGYSSAEDIKNETEELPIGVLPIDAIYTPIKLVNYQIEKIRVGQKDDYDKLTLDVSTDGSVEPSDAVSLASKILMDHLNIFSTVNDIEEPDMMVEKVEPVEDTSVDMTIEDLYLSVRSYNCLKRAGVNSVQDLMDMTEQEMMKVRNLGRKSFDEVKAKLEALDLSFKPE